MIAAEVVTEILDPGAPEPGAGDSRPDAESIARLFAQGVCTQARRSLLGLMLTEAASTGVTQGLG